MHKRIWGYMDPVKVFSLFVVSVLIFTTGYCVYLIYGTGTITVKLKDSPVEWGPASDVYIKYSAIWIHRAEEGEENGWTKMVDYWDWVNLKEVLNATKEIGSKTVLAGRYNLLRFEIEEAIVTVDGKNYTSIVESGKINVAIKQGGLTLYAGQTSGMIIDILPKVVGSTKGGFKIFPAVKAFPEI